MPKSKKNRKLPPNTEREVHTWLQKAPMAVVNAATARGGSDLATAHMGLNKLVPLVKYFLRAFALGDVDIRRKP